MSNQKGLIGIVAIILLVLLIPALVALYVFGTQEDRTFIVNKTERVQAQDGGSAKYLVFTKEKGVLENTDSWFRLKFNSSDVHGQLEAGKKYTCDTFGWRIPFLSQYPNIVSCEEIK